MQVYRHKVLNNHQGLSKVIRIHPNYIIIYFSPLFVTDSVLSCYVFLPVKENKINNKKVKTSKGAHECLSHIL